MKTRNWIILTCLGLLGVLALRPIPIPEEKDCLSLTGTVTEIYEAGTKDVVFKLKNPDKEFYINRGLERGLELEKLRADLMNKEILIKYPKNRFPFLFSYTSHISKVEFEGRTVFTEVD